MNYTAKAEEFLNHYFLNITWQKNNGMVFKEVNRKMNYGINALEHDLTKESLIVMVNLSQQKK